MAKIKNRHNERGNVLILILITIFLLGLLTAILSRTSSTVDQSADVEQLRVRISQLLRYARSVEAEVQNMRLQGISENAISFAGAPPLTDYINTNCDDPTTTTIENDQACLLFDGGGAGLNYRPAPVAMNDGSDWIFTGHNSIGSSNNPVGTENADLIMLLPQMNSADCDLINRDLGITSLNDIPFNASTPSFIPFTGTYSNNAVTLQGTNDELDGQATGCFENNGILYFYHVLIPR